MSDFFNPATSHTCCVSRNCSYCSEQINKGDLYIRQTGVWEGSWFTNHFHPECFRDLCDSGEGEFTPYSNERPTVVEDVHSEPMIEDAGIKVVFESCDVTAEVEAALHAAEGTTKDAEPAAPDIQQIIYALERQASDLQEHANRLSEKLDYSAQFPADDAERMREAIAILKDIQTPPLKPKPLAQMSIEELELANWRHIWGVLQQARDYLQKDGVRHTWLDGAIDIASEKSLGITTAKQEGTTRSAEPQPCIGRDPLCPCRDGDVCHYRDAGDSKAFVVPAGAAGVLSESRIAELMQQAFPRTKFSPAYAKLARLVEAEVVRRLEIGVAQAKSHQIQVGWIDEFGNLFPMDSWGPKKIVSYHDTHKIRWQPVYLHRGA
jgi:hypothetical protein